MPKTSKNKISVFYIFCFLFIASLSSLNANNQNKKMNLEKIVLMGNSITEGWQTIFVVVIFLVLLINKGISGQTTPQMLIRFKPDVINLNPKCVVIMAGINDIAGNTGVIT